MSGRSHPYLHKPDRAFWSRAVTRGFDARDMLTPAAPLLLKDDRIVSAGSCFAANIAPLIERAGFHYLRTEIMDEDGDRFGYSRYSAGYGNIYTPRQLLQLLRRATGAFKAADDRWREEGRVIDLFRPGLACPAEDDEELDLITRSHLSLTLQAFCSATVLIFTLGLTEAWVSKIDGAVYPVCPGMVAGAFDPDRYQFVNLGVSETIADLRAALRLLREINGGLRVILSVSPVPLMATATPAHVLTASTYSKSVLRVACEEICASEPGVIYFPAYEIIHGPDQGQNFESDLRTISACGLAAVASALFAHSQTPDVPGVAGRRDLSVDLSRALVQCECEEALNDPARS